MALTASQQNWQNQYEAQRLAQGNAKREVDRINAIDPLVRTQSDQNLLELSQRAHIDAEKQLIGLQESITANLKADEKRIQLLWVVENPDPGSSRYDQLTAWEIGNSAQQLELVQVASTWTIPDEGATQYNIGGIIYSNNGSAHPDGTFAGVLAYNLMRLDQYAVKTSIDLKNLVTADYTSWFNSLPVQSRYDLCKEIYERDATVFGAVLPSMGLPAGDLARQAAKYLEKAGEEGIKIAAGACEILIKKEHFFEILGQLSGEPLPEGLLDSLPNQISFSFISSIAAELAANAAAQNALTQTYLNDPNASEAVLAANAEQAYAQTISDFSSDAIGTWNGVLFESAETLASLYKESAIPNTPVPQVDLTPISFGYTQSTAPASGPVTNFLDVSTNIASQTTQSGSSDPNAQAAEVQQGFLIKNGDYFVSMAAAAVNGNGGQIGRSGSDHYNHLI